MAIWRLDRSKIDEGRVTRSSIVPFDQVQDSGKIQVRWRLDTSEIDVR